MILEKIFGKKKQQNVKFEVEHLETKVKTKSKTKAEPSESLWDIPKVKEFQKSSGSVSYPSYYENRDKVKPNPVVEYAKNSDLGTIMIDSHTFLERDFLNPIGRSGISGYTIYTYVGNNGVEDLKTVIDAGYEITELYSAAEIESYNMGSTGSTGYSGSMGMAGTSGTLGTSGYPGTSGLNYKRD